MIFSVSYNHKINLIFKVLIKLNELENYNASRQFSKIIIIDKNVHTYVA